MSPKTTPIYKVWWERLVYSHATKGTQLCPSCGEYNDSVDVVCSYGSAALVGLKLNNQTKGYIINGLRILAVGVALAVGYLHLLWPAYVFISAILYAFFALFMRNHPLCQKYFIGISILAFIVQVSWIVYFDQILTFGELLVGVILFIIILELAFLIVFTIRVRRTNNDSRCVWMKSNNIDLPLKTMTWISFMLTAFLVCWIIFYVASVFEQLPFIETIFRILIRLSLSALGGAFVVALISSTIFSLSGEPFKIQDRWVYRPIFQEKNFKQTPIPEKKASKSWQTRFANTIDRVLVISTNKMVQTFESAFNKLVVKTSNLAFSITIQLANFLRRSIIKFGRHIVRTFRRFVIVNLWCSRWAWYAGKQFFITYFFPLVISFIAAYAMYSMADDFFHYVHEGPILLALKFFLKLFVVIVLLTILTGLLLHIRISAIAEKVLGAFSVFGTSAFLFFLLIAWSLGILGMLTDGPYRVGPVTILSTIALIAMFVSTRRRSQ